MNYTILHFNWNCRLNKNFHKETYCNIFSLLLLLPNFLHYVLYMNNDFHNNIQNHCRFNCSVWGFFFSWYLQLLAKMLFLVGLVHRLQYRCTQTPQRDTNSEFCFAVVKVLIQFCDKTRKINCIELQKVYPFRKANASHIVSFLGVTWTKEMEDIILWDIVVVLFKIK